MSNRGRHKKSIIDKQIKKLCKTIQNRNSNNNIYAQAIKQGHTVQTFYIGYLITEESLKQWLKETAKFSDWDELYLDNFHFNINKIRKNESW